MRDPYQLSTDDQFLSCHHLILLAESVGCVLVRDGLNLMHLLIDYDTAMLTADGSFRYQHIIGFRGVFRWSAY
jgi:hypothetical protein